MNGVDEADLVVGGPSVPDWTVYRHGPVISLGESYCDLFCRRRSAHAQLGGETD